MSAYRVMDAEKATYRIGRMARLLGASRSGYYAWARREAAGPSAGQRRRAELTAKIVVFHEDSDRVYGSPRILADLRAAGERVSAKTVARLMRAGGIAGISPRRFTPITTIAGPDPHPVPDLAGRRFDRGRLNAIWTSDITYLATGQGWLYLCAVRDGCSRRVIGWAIADHLRADLVEAALRMAVALRGTLPQRVVFHADRGTQGGFNWSSQHLDRGVERWVLVRSKRGLVRIGGRSRRRGARQLPGARTGSGSGLRSLVAKGPSRHAARRACRPRSGSGGSATLAA